MTTAGDDSARLEARNAAMKDQVDTLLEQFERQTAQLRDAQEAASQTSATVVSQDGLVRATIDATGTLAKLEIQPNAFERTTPAQLANTVLNLVRQGSLQVKQQVADLMAPITEGLPDLSDLIEGAPSLQGLLPSIPDFLAEEEETAPSKSDEDFDAPLMIKDDTPSPPPAPPAPPAPKPVPKRVRRQDDDEEEPPSSWMTRGV
ncbi:YbaB/EbfC family nucleoid-associated protein [Amycolatopsis sp. QT-25]|uniref:YbaB/EbfC family nucleoid-associated protein n=1 Tax=Amycolatopsis sp. QT-25 TaxID=3034022 RepID=UPI0023EBAB27|nr:YbaB/EbfC family nucleoid-associated protein [Amycolatopsis sp. QT-25]WET79661.1 YbaB/EbfC family nucleoid-associated protein [Amycolatopsis sp. QT-25]